MAKTAKATAEKVNEKKTSKEGAPPHGPTQDAVVQAESQKQAQSVEFPEAIGRQSPGSPNKLDILLDMSVPVTVSIGRTEIPVRQLLQLGPGSVLKLDKPIDEPADLFLKDAKFAVGDIVVVDDQFAVRIKQIIGAGVSSDQAST